MKDEREQRLKVVQEHLNRRDYASAKSAVTEVLKNFLDAESPHDRKSVRHFASALLMLGTCEFETGSADTARAIFQHGLNMATLLEDELLESAFLHELSLVAYVQGSTEESLALCNRSIAKALDVAFVPVHQGLTPGYVDFDLSQFAGSLNQLAVLLQETDRHDEAREILTILKAHAERVYNLDLLGVVLNELGATCFAAGKFAEGVRFFLDSIKIKSRRGHNSAGIFTSARNLQAGLHKHPEALSIEEVRCLLEEYRP